MHSFQSFAPTISDIPMAQSHSPSPSLDLDLDMPSGSASPDSALPSRLNGEGKARANSSGAGGKKLAPVKAACLSCRAKKARCDGKQPVCGQCSKKNIECLYVKSRRGGARKRRPAVAPTALQLFLKKLDNLLGLPEFDVAKYSADPNASDDPTNIVRQFSTREEVFAAYYDDVHPFCPVMPPRQYLKTVLPSLQPASPFLLAVQTILVLIPHPDDPTPGSSNSKRLRQLASQALAQQTMQLVHTATANGQTTLESVQALSMLSVWEWSNGSNIVRTKERAALGMQLAVEMGLNEMDRYGNSEGAEWQRDMARRTWWNLYASQLLASIVSGTAPVMDADDPRIHVDFPTTAADDHTWPNYVETLRNCIRTFSLVNSVYYNDAVGSSWGGRPTDDSQEKGDPKGRIVDTDRQVLELLKQAESTSIIELVPGGEEEVVRNFQMAARLGLAVMHIHIHRNQAFPEVSLFSKKICGLPQAPDFTASPGMSGTPTTTDDQSVPLSATPSVNHDLQAWNEAYGQPPSTNGNSNGYSDGQYGVKELTSSGSAAVYGYTDSSANGSASYNGYPDGSYYDNTVDQLDFTHEMWQPDTYPETLPPPWFTYAGGAAALYAPVDQQPTFHPPVSASIVPISSSPHREGRRSSAGSSSHSAKPHKAWGVDERADKVLPPLGNGQLQIFPPGISLARCATAAHTIVRLEVLHRSAVIAMYKGPPRWAPFCSCGLVTGAYAFLLLALAVQAENNFEGYNDTRSEEVEALLTNVKVILAGLETYGQVWAGIDAMAGEVRAALEAATRLPYEISEKVESNSPTDQEL